MSIFLNFWTHRHRNGHRAWQKSCSLKLLTLTWCSSMTWSWGRSDKAELFWSRNKHMFILLVTFLPVKQDFAHPVHHFLHLLHFFNQGHFLHHNWRKTCNGHSKLKIQTWLIKDRIYNVQNLTCEWSQSLLFLTLNYNLQDTGCPRKKWPYQIVMRLLNGHFIETPSTVILSKSCVNSNSWGDEACQYPECLSWGKCCKHLPLLLHNILHIFPLRLQNSMSLSPEVTLQNAPHLQHLLSLFTTALILV